MPHADARVNRPGRVPLGRITAPWQAGFILIISIGMALLWWFPLQFMVAKLDRQHAGDIAAPAQHFIDHPTHFLLLTIPAVLAGVLVFIMNRGKVVMVCIAWLLELIPVFVLVYLFISFLAPLYTYQEL